MKRIKQRFTDLSGLIIREIDEDDFGIAFRILHDDYFNESLRADSGRLIALCERAREAYERHDDRLGRELMSEVKRAIEGERIVCN